MRLQARKAFTVIEMVVAIAIGIVVIWIVNQLFNDTSKAIRHGIAMSELMHNARGISDKLYHDSQHLLGPAVPNGGVLVIKSAVVSNQPWEEHDGSTINRDVRVDQLIYFVEGKFHALTPDSSSTFANTRTAQYGRVWYGHVSRTAANGSGGGSSFGPVANQYILGRQLLLLAGSSSGLYAETVNNDADVEGIDGSVSAPGRLYGAFTDVCEQTIDDLTGLTDPNDPPVYDTADDHGDYADAVDNMLFTTSNAMRLNLQVDQVTLAAELYGQTHTYLGAYVSDFIVEFAGDYVDDNSDGKPDGAIDRDGTTKEIIWYAGIADNSANTVTVPTTSPHFSGTKPARPFYDSTNKVVIFRHDDTQEPDADSWTKASGWPQLIRIRYRLHDRTNRVRMGSNNQTGRWFEQIIPIQVLNR